MMSVFSVFDKRIVFSMPFQSANPEAMYLVSLYVRIKLSVEMAWSISVLFTFWFKQTKCVLASSSDDTSMDRFIAIDNRNFLSRSNHQMTNSRRQSADDNQQTTISRQQVAERKCVFDLVQLGCDVIEIITTCLNEDKCILWHQTDFYVISVIPRQIADDSRIWTILMIAMEGNSYDIAGSTSISNASRSDKNSDKIPPFSLLSD